MKRFYALILTLLVVGACVPISAGAAIRDGASVQPMYLYTSDVTAKLTISSSGNASCTGKIYAWNDSSNITMTVVLYRQTDVGWTKIADWEKNATGVDHLTIFESYSVEAGTYKVVVTGTVTDPGVGTEAVSKSSTETIYK